MFHFSTPDNGDMVVIDSAELETSSGLPEQFVRIRFNVFVHPPGLFIRNIRYVLEVDKPRLILPSVNTDGGPESNSQSVVEIWSEELEDRLMKQLNRLARSLHPYMVPDYLEDDDDDESLDDK